MRIVQSLKDIWTGAGRLGSLMQNPAAGYTLMLEGPKTLQSMGMEFSKADRFCSLIGITFGPVEGKKKLEELFSACDAVATSNPDKIKSGFMPERYRAKELLNEKLFEPIGSWADNILNDEKQKKFSSTQELLEVTSQSFQSLWDELNISSQLSRVLRAATPILPEPK